MILEKIQDAMIEASAFAIIGAFSTLIIGSCKLYLDVRSLRRGSRSAFTKIRRIEKKVFGDVTSELDEDARTDSR